MSFTTPSLLKAHLLSASVPEQVIENLPVTLHDTTPVALPHHNLVAGSESVKWETANTVTLDSEITLTEFDDASLSHEFLVPGSVVVAFSETLETVYVEELDYQVDHALGRIHRVPGGSISDGQTVLVAYSYYTLFASDVDYTLDESNGLLVRDENGGIPDGATVLVDYTVTAGTVEDDLIAAAIIEAEDLIVRFLAPDYNSGSADQGLKTGATELALSIICRAQAAEALSRRSTTDIPGRAKEWQQLSRFYEQQAYQTLSPFLLPMHLRSTFRQPREP